MAASNGSTQREAPGQHARTIGVWTPVFQLIPGTGNREIRDQLESRLGHLSTMLTMTYGNGIETFAGWSREVRNDYMACCFELAKECEALAAAIDLREVPGSPS